MAPRATDRKPPLSVERIVDVAIEQLRERGYDAVTMRSIASALGTGQASLYAHVANRTELDRLVVARAMRSIEIPQADPDTWEQQLRDIMHASLRSFRDNPGVARCSLGIVPMGPDELDSIEAIFAIMRAGRVPDQAAAWFADLMALYVAAVAAEEDIERLRSTQSKDAEDFAAAFSALPAERYPILLSLASTLVQGDADDRFGFGVDVLIAGLKSMA